MPNLTNDNMTKKVAKVYNRLKKAGCPVEPRKEWDNNNVLFRIVGENDILNQLWISYHEPSEAIYNEKMIKELSKAGLLAEWQNPAYMTVTKI